MGKREGISSDLNNWFEGVLCVGAICLTKVMSVEVVSLDFAKLKPVDYKGV